MLYSGGSSDASPVSYGGGNVDVLSMLFGGGSADVSLVSYGGGNVYVSPVLFGGDSADGSLTSYGGGNVAVSPMLYGGGSDVLQVLYNDGCVDELLVVYANSVEHVINSISTFPPDDGCMSRSRNIDICIY